MKILQLELQNINSLKSDTPIRIDFTDKRFTDTGIFAITGPTGAGKTTLLDAITIALYRKVPRFNAPHIKSDLTDIISRGAGEAMARVTFSNEGQVYEAFWSMNLIGKNGRTLKKPTETVRLKNLTTQKILAEKPTEFQKEIEKITRLNYRQFLRSMMLAQGEFAAFLKAPKKEKVELLDQIIGKDIYKKIGETVATRINAEKNKLTEIEHKINREDLLDDARKKELKTEQKEIRKKLINLKNQARNLEKIRQYYLEKNRLEKEIQELTDEKQALSHDMTSRQNLLDALQLHLKAEPFEKILTRLKNHKTDKNTTLNKLAEIKPALQQAAVDKKDIGLQLSLAEKQVEKARKTENKWRPLLNKITRMDTEIINLKKKREELNAEIHRLQEKIKSNQQELVKKTGEQTECKQKLEEINTYLNKRSFLPEIEENLNKWTVQLNRRKNIHSEQNTLQKEMKTREKESEEMRRKIKKLKAEFEKQKAKIDKQKQERELLQKELGKYKLNELNRQWQQSLELKEKLSQALEIAGQIKTKKEQIIQHKLHTNQLDKEAEKINREIKELKEKILLNKEIVNGLKRESELENKVKSLEEERRKLREGEACPLCGATEHPFVKKYENYDFSKTAQRLARQEKILEDLQLQLRDKENKRSEINAFLLTKKEYITKTQKEIALLENEYQNLSVAIPYSDENQLQKERNNLLKKTEEFQEKIKKANLLQEKFNRLNEDFQTADKNLSALQEKLNITRTQHQNLLQNIENNRNKSEKVSTELHQLEQDLSRDFSPYGITLPAYEKTEVLINKLNERIHTYKTRENEKNRLENQLQVLTAEIKHLKNLIALDEKELLKKIDKRKELDKSMEKIRMERKEILPLEISVDNKNLELQKLINQAGELLEKRQNQQLQIEKRISGLQAEEKALKENLEKLNTNIRQLETELNRQLQKSDFKSRLELESALLDYDIKQKYLRIQKELEDRQTALNVREKEIKTKLKDLSESPEISPEETDTQLLEIEKQKESLQLKLGKLESLFENDRKLRERNSKILLEIKEQEKVIKKWNTLFSLLGGTKDAFNIYVQRLTLKSLINHANLHLARFNDRYSLRLASLDNTDKNAQKELNMELIDHYQAGSIRPVETCSGGESFLMSLSLALGLSDMASRNVKIESLFIDEGFGTLDDDLLETVISTLESLQSDGKIIGIISHVEQLKERIGTQIKVEKTGNGVSRIVVMG